MKISVVTVCRNEEKNIERTIRSVLAQNCNDFEYIICDGESTDRTLEIADSYKSAFEEKNIPYRIISKKDNGTYFGMNNAIDAANGDYIIFMNSGDRFNNKDVIKDTVSAMSGIKADIYCGETNYIENGYCWLIGNDCNKLDKFMSVNHQAIFASSELMKKRPFDTKYRICADYDFLLYAKYNGYKLVNIDVVVADYTSEGLSEANLQKTTDEAIEIASEHIPDMNKKEILATYKKINFTIKLKRSAPHFVWALFCLVAGRKKYEDKDI